MTKTLSVLLKGDFWREFAVLGGGVPEAAGTSLKLKQNLKSGREGCVGWYWTPWPFIARSYMSKAGHNS